MLCTDGPSTPHKQTLVASWNTANPEKEKRELADNLPEDFESWLPSARLLEVWCVCVCERESARARESVCSDVHIHIHADRHSGSGHSRVVCCVHVYTVCAHALSPSLPPSLPFSLARSLTHEQAGILAVGTQENDQQPKFCQLISKHLAKACGGASYHLMSAPAAGGICLYLW
jgi:hypothetical protein